MLATGAGRRSSPSLSQLAVPQACLSVASGDPDTSSTTLGGK